jgi:hypothetical protein
MRSLAELKDDVDVSWLDGHYKRRRLPSKNYAQRPQLCGFG